MAHERSTVKPRCHPSVRYVFSVWKRVLLWMIFGWPHLRSPRFPQVADFPWKPPGNDHMGPTKLEVRTIFDSPEGPAIGMGYGDRF